MSEVLIAPRGRTGRPVHMVARRKRRRLAAMGGLAASLARLAVVHGQGGIAADRAAARGRASSASSSGVGRRRRGDGAARAPDAVARPATIAWRTRRGWIPTLAATAWALGSYAFDRYKARKSDRAPRLVAPEGADLAEALRVVPRAALARDMVNTPAGDLGPAADRDDRARDRRAARGDITVTTGEALLEQNYPAIHAVGRAAAPTARRG
jgi:leucyl aminopeptidase